MSLSLYLDTGGRIATIALFRDSELLIAKENHEPKNHNTILHRTIQENLEEHGYTLKSLSEVWVMNGPGSYTGLRTGLSVAKGLCYALDIPLFLINRFDGLYHSQYQTDVTVLFHARANEYFYGSYLDGKPDGEYRVVTDVDLHENLLKLGRTVLSDEILDIPGLEVEVVKPDLHLLGGCISGHLKKTFQAELMNSEPFYYKNVHFGK